MLNLLNKRCVYRGLRIFSVCLFATAQAGAQSADARLEGVLVVLDCREAPIEVLANDPGARAIRTARDCVKMGAPLAVLVGADKNYVLFTLSLSPPALVNYLGKTVIVRGQEIAPRIVLPEHISAEIDSEWVEVPITSVM